MGTLRGFGPLASYIRRELAIDAPIGLGTRGARARRVQEWLTLHGHPLVIDGDFGPATASAVAVFSSEQDLTGQIVDEAVWRRLTAPLEAVLSPPSVPGGASFSQHVLSLARHHLASRPKEVGGANAGPWVRLYMKGNEGVAWPWCAGFVSFLIGQAAEWTGRPLPLDHSFSCDWLAADAKARGTFRHERVIEPDDLMPGSVFLRRRTPTDWTHTGIVDHPGRAAFTSIEGNTNDQGSREGVEVCARTCAYRARDFIVLA